MPSKRQEQPKLEPKPELPTLSGPKVIEEVIEKVSTLTKEVRPLGHPRASQADVIGALIYVATAQSAAAALTEYAKHLGEALDALDRD
jgi:ABC-type transporter Mla subunit MlaD